MEINKQSELQTGVEWLEDFEGFEPKIYLDTELIDTVGIGRNLEVFPFTEEEAEEYAVNCEWSHGEACIWAYHRLEQCRKDIMVHKPWLVMHPEVVRLIVTDMTYNLGLKGVLGFQNMFRKLRAFDYQGAALELEDSKYFKQTGQRSLHHYRKLLELS